MVKGFLKPRLLQLASAAGLMALALAASANESPRTNVANASTSTSAASASPLSANPHAKSLEANWKLLEDYCVECHNATDWAGGVAFDTMEPGSVAADAEIWEESVRKLRGTLMPPPYTGCIPRVYTPGA